MMDLARMTKAEAYDAGLAAGRAEVEASGPKWTKPSFALAAIVTLFAMWMAGYLLTHAETPDLALVQALIATVGAVPLLYVWQQKPSARKDP